MSDRDLNLLGACVCVVLALYCGVTNRLPLAAAFMAWGSAFRAHMRVDDILAKMRKHP